MAAVLFAAGLQGQAVRCCPTAASSSTSRWLSGLQGQQTDIEIHAKDMLMMRDRLDEILAFHTGKSKEEIHHDTERD